MKLAQTTLSETDRLKELRSYKVLDTAAEREFDDITELASQICQTPVALLSLVDERRQWFKSSVGFDEQETDRDHSFCSHAILENEVMEVRDTSTDPRFKDNPLVTKAPYIRFYAGAPIVTNQGYALGTLCVIDTQPRALTDMQNKALKMLARQIVTQLEFKRTQIKLSDQNIFQSSILNSTDALIITTDPNGLITFVNATAERLLEYQSEELVKRATALRLHDPVEIANRKSDLIHECKRMLINDHYALIGEARDGKIEHRMWTLISKNGTRLELEMTINRLIHADGEFMGYLHVAPNPNHTLDTQKKLFIEKSRLQGVIEGIGASTWEWNIPEKRFTFNERWVQILGYSLPELESLGENIWRRYMHPDDFKKSEEALNQYIRNETKVYQQEFRFKHKEGYWVWIQSQGRIVSRNMDGTPLMMYGIHIDISDRKLAESKLHDQQKKLQTLVEQRTAEIASNAAFVNSVIESSPDCLKILSKTGKMLYMTARGCQIMEVNDFCDIEGADWAEFWTGQDKDIVQLSIGKAGEGQTSHFQAMAPTLKGNQKWWDVAVSPIVEKNGQINKLLVVSRDISHQKKLEDTLRTWNQDLEKQIEQRTIELADARDAAESANRAKTGFLTSMSHGIRTPLNAIIGISELLEQSKTVKERKRLVKLTQECAHSLLDIICDILDISKIEAGQIEINLEPMSLKAAFLSATDVFAQTSQTKGIDFLIHIDDEIPETVMCDPLRLRQILFSVLGHASKNSQEGEIKFNAKLKTEQNTGRHIEIQVIDSGERLDTNTTNQIATPLNQSALRERSVNNSLGLGLATAKKLCELLNGNMEITSSLNNNQITITLPIAAFNRKTLDPKDHGNLNKSVNTPEIVPNFVVNARILIADDNESNRVLLSNQLRLMGCRRVDVACDGLEALSKWITGHFDLIICDCQMPKMDGFDVAMHIREINILHLNQRHIPVLGYTADALKETRERCLRSGMDDVLVKPVGMSTLKEKLRYWLNPSNEHNPENSNTVAPVDWQSLDEATGYDREFAKDLLLGLIADKAKHLKKLGEMIKNQDIPGIMRVAHKIKGAALGLSAKPLADTCRLIETAAQQGDDNIVKTGKELLEAEFARIRDLLEND